MSSSSVVTPRGIAFSKAAGGFSGLRPRPPRCACRSSAKAGIVAANARQRARRRRSFMAGRRRRAGRRAGRLQPSTGRLRMTRILLAAAAAVVLAATSPSPAIAQASPCPAANLMYWQAFPPGGESDLSARHQQVVLKKKCPAIDTVIQYKAGAGGALLGSQTNPLPADGVNVVGINLPHMVLQPMEGNVSYKTDDVTPVFWFHYTPDLLVVHEGGPIKTFADFIKAAKESPGKINLGGSGLNSANHAAHERLNRDFGIKTTYVPYKGTGDLALAVLGNHIDGAMTD